MKDIGDYKSIYSANPLEKKSLKLSLILIIICL